MRACVVWEYAFVLVKYWYTKRATLSGRVGYQWFSRYPNLDIYWTGT